MKNLSKEEMVMINGGSTVDPKDKERTYYGNLVDSLGNAIVGAAGWVASWFN